MKNVDCVLVLDARDDDRTREPFGSFHILEIIAKLVCGKTNIDEQMEEKVSHVPTEKGKQDKCVKKKRSGEQRKRASAERVVWCGRLGRLGKK